MTHFATGKDFHSPTVVALTSAVWYLLLALGVAVALLAARKWPERRVWIAAAVVVLAAGDMLHFAAGYQPMGPASKTIPPKTGAIAYLQRHSGDGRIVGIGQALPNDWALTYGLHDIRGYDPPQPSVRYYRLWKLAEAEQLDWTAFQMESLSPTAMQVASVLGARYVVATPGAVPSEGRDPAVRALRVTYDGRDARVFSNARAAPRALVPAVVREVPDEAAARALLAETSFDPRREAVVEQGAQGSGALGPAGAAGSSGTVSVDDASNARVVMHAQLSRPGLVVLNDSWSPGWSVQVDGHAARVVRVNDVMRGVSVGGGTHVVEWRYAVPGLRTGLALTVLALLAAAACLAWAGGLAGRLSRRRPKLARDA